MYGHCTARLKGAAAAAAQASFFFFAISLSICWLSGWPLLGLLGGPLGGPHVQQSLEGAGERVYALSPAVKVQGPPFTRPQLPAAAAAALLHRRAAAVLRCCTAALQRCCCAAAVLLCCSAAAALQPLHGGSWGACAACVLQEAMEKAGVVHSACFEKERKEENEFLICIGRANCAHAKTRNSAQLVPAPEALESPEGKRKSV